MKEAFIYPSLLTPLDQTRTKKVTFLKNLEECTAKIQHYIQYPRVKGIPQCVANMRNRNPMSNAPIITGRLSITGNWACLLKNPRPVEQQHAHRIDIIYLDSTHGSDSQLRMSKSQCRMSNVQLPMSKEVCLIESIMDRLPPHKAFAFRFILLPAIYP